MIHVVFMKSRVNFRGGSEKYTHYLMQAFLQKGCRVTLLTTGEIPPIEGVRILSLAPDSKFTLYHLLRFDLLCQQWLKNNPHTIAFGMERTTSQTYYRAGNGVHAIYLQRRKLIDSFWKKISLTLNPLHYTLLHMEKKAFEDPKLKILFTNSEMVRQEILNTYSTDPAKIEVVHNGVEWDRWDEDFERSFDKQRGGPFQILFVGNGYRRKGLLFLLQGLERLKKEDFHLTVIGKERDPSFFIEWAKKHGLKEKIEFLGPQNGLIPFYQKADALVLPTIYDPFANVTVEALAMGLFVLSSRYNGGIEVLQEYSGRVIQEITSPESVAAALQQTFQHPKTAESAQKIRQSIKGLDFSIQLDKIVRKTLETIL